jgi:protein-disulfide isomerase
LTANRSKAVSSARRSNSDRTKIIVGIVVVVLIAGAVIGGVLYSNAQKNKTEGQVIRPVASSADYPVRRDGAVVIAGKDDAKITIDIYEDFLCPFCRQFEENYGPTIDQKLTDGTIKVRYHLVTILNDASDPPGYSLDAANAGLCAADAGRFPGFYKSLFTSQPSEGARGYDKNQLTRLGTDLGITTPDFASCISSSKYNPTLETATTTAANTPHLQKAADGTQKGFGTPTVAAGDRIMDLRDPNWLTNLTTAS